MDLVSYLEWLYRQDLAKTHHGQLSLGLPDVGGLELCRRFRSTRELIHVPIVVMTGKESVEDKVSAFEMGVVDYINKPFQISELLARIMAHLRHKRSRDLEEAAHLIEKQRTNDELRKMSKAMDSTSDAICILDHHCTVEYVNGAFVQLFGKQYYAEPSSVALSHLFTKPETWDAVQSAGSLSKSWAGEVELYSANREALACLCRIDPIVDDSCATQRSVMILSEITQRKRLERDLLYLANHDPLTGLYNRRYFDELLEIAVLNARRGQVSYLLYMDLDNFKVVNDSAGHAAGDRLLIEISKILRLNTRDDDKIGRFGGDEFTALLVGANHSDALTISRRLLNVFDEFRFFEQGRSFFTSVSIGLAVIDGSLSGEDVLAQADSACYMVKSKGRNGLEVFKADSGDIQQLSRDASWSIIIKDSLKEERFELWLQPIRPLKKQINLYFEVLIRLRDREGNIVMPGVFLPAAERFGNIQQLDHFVIRKAVSLLRIQLWRQN